MCVCADIETTQDNVNIIKKVSVVAYLSVYGHKDTPKEMKQYMQVSFLFLFQLFQPKEHPKASSDKHCWAEIGYLRVRESPYATHPI